MKEKATDDLRQELMADNSIDTYLRSNRSVFERQSVAELLTELYDRRPMSKAPLARATGISEVYLHQIFSGRRCPSRSRLLCVCMGLQATMEETQRILKEASYAPLYPKNKRDAIISHGILHSASMEEINRKLLAEHEKPLLQAAESR